MTRIERLEAIANENGVTATIRELGGKIYSNINGASFIVNSPMDFESKCKELKDYVAPAPIDLTARLIRIENSAIGCI